MAPQGKLPCDPHPAREHSGASDEWRQWSFCPLRFVGARDVRSRHTRTRRNIMNTRVPFVGAGLAVVLLLASPVSAAKPTFIPIDVDVTFQSGFLTDACGIPVFV